MLTVYKAKWILPANEKFINDGAVIVDDGRIVDVIDNSDPDLEEYYFNRANKIIDYKHAVITPGFINLHAHLQYTNLNNDVSQIKPDDFIGWITELVSQYFLMDNDRKIGSFLNGIKESVLSGTTCIAQLSREEDYFKILNNTNLKSYIFLETFSNNEELSEIEFNNIKNDINKYSAESSNNTYLGISPHSVYNVHPSFWKKISEYSSENDILVQTHFAESVAEMNWLKEGYSDIDTLHKLVGWDKINPYETGLNPVQYLSKLDILDNMGKNLILAHLNQLQDESLKELAGYGISLVHCPRSNVILHNKTLNIENLVNSDLFKNHIGIGTDSKFSNYDLNVIHEAKYIKSSTGLGLLKLLDMLTIDAAKILRLEDKIGSLEKGKDADFTVFNLEDNETYQDLLEKDSPDDVYIQGKSVVKDKVLEESFLSHCMFAV